VRINFTRILIIRLTALVLIAACVFQVPAQAATTEVPADGSVRSLFNGISAGIADGQSIRATLANLVPTGANRLDTITFSAILTLYDERGSVVAQSERAQILPGKFHSFDIHRAAIRSPGDEKTGRVQVFAELKVFASMLDEAEAQAIKERAAEFLPVSFELINDTGETSVFEDIIGWSFSPNTNNPSSGQGDDVIVSGFGNDFIIGIVPGESLLFTARNLSTPDETGEAISMQVKVHDKNGDVIAVSREVEIPPGEFRTVRFNHEDLATAEEPGTRRKQIRTIPLWGLRNRGRLVHVAGSLEFVNNSTGRTLGGHVKAFSGITGVL
jgi:hypothetical protein